MPFGMWGYPSVVLFKEKVYIGGGITLLNREEQTVVVYDPKQDSCCTLHPYTYKYFSMVVINDQLVLVGGCKIEAFQKKINKLAVWNEQSKQWTHPLPPMTTACSSPSVASHNNKWLVVMGGKGDEVLLSRVEILDTTDPIQWYQATSLPHPCYQVPCATIGNKCYLMGGFIEDDKSNKKVFSVCLDDLISRAVSQPVSATTTPSPWHSLPDTPLYYSTALAFNGALLAIGGGDYPGSSTIHMYQSSSNSWVKVGELRIERRTSGCIVLPSGEVLVAGGGQGNTHKMIEIASIL